MSAFTHAMRGAGGGGSSSFTVYGHRSPTSSEIRARRRKEINTRDRDVDLIGTDQTGYITSIDALADANSCANQTSIFFLCE